MKLLEAIGRSGMTGRVIAKKMAGSASFAPMLSKFANGKCNPTVGQMGELCTILGKDVYELYDREELDYSALSSKTPQKQKKADRHKLSRRLQCRLQEEDFTALQGMIKADGFDTVQSFLYYTVSAYLRRKKKKEAKEMQGKECKSCGAMLDPGEKCDCMQYDFLQYDCGIEKAAPGATITESGKQKPQAMISPSL